MAVEQHEPSAGAVSEFEFSIFEGIVDRHYLPRQRGGNAGSRRARAQAAMLADMLRVAREGRAGVEGAGE
jgi:hypothetical protein